KPYLPTSSYEYDLTITAGLLESEAEGASLSQLTVEVVGLDTSAITDWKVGGEAISPVVNVDGTITLTLPAGSQSAEISATVTTDTPEANWSIKGSVSAMLNGETVGDVAEDTASPHEFDVAVEPRMMSFSLLDDDSESLSFDVFDTLDEINADQSGLSTDTATSEQEGAIPEDLLSDQEQFVDTSNL